MGAHITDPRVSEAKVVLRPPTSLSYLEANPAQTGRSLVTTRRVQAVLQLAWHQSCPTILFDSYP